MAPPFLPGDDNAWKKVAKEIIIATTALKLCQDGKPASPPQDKHLRLFQHISTLITTGEFGEEEEEEDKRKNDPDHDAAIVNAVTGRVELGRIVSVVFTHNAVRMQGQPNGKYQQIRPKDNGKVLLDGWETMQDKVKIGVHLQDVVDILQHLLRGDRGPRDVAATALFVQRRAFPKLASRVQKAVRLWGGAPFRVILQYYKNPLNSPIEITDSLFLLRDPKGNLHNSLEAFGLACDSSYSSSDGIRRYVVHFENVVKWIEFIDSTYGKIEAIVERNTIGGRRAVTPLSAVEARVLVPTLSVLNVLIQTEELMTAIFSMEGLKGYLAARFLIAGASSKVHKPGDSQPSASEATDEADEDDEDEDALNWSVSAPGDVPILRYCRTITGWVEAVLAVARHMNRLPNDMDLRVYRVNTSPAIPTVQPSDVEDFREGYMQTMTFATEDEAARAQKFVADRLSVGREKKFCGKANKAVVHAEATAMGLICISALGGESFGDFTKKWVESALPTSGEMTIAVSKKCCRSCAILVHLLNARLLNAPQKGKFVLPGTHATFFPWCPPSGVPLDILKEMRDQLYRIFDFQARNYASVILTTQSSPAMSEPFLPELIDEI